MRETEAEFVGKYITGSDKPVVEIDASTPTWVHITDAAGRSLWVDIRGIGGADSEYLCIDVHPYQNNEPAKVAPWGMTRGLRHSLDFTGFTTLGHPAVDMPILIMADQPTRPDCLFGPWPEKGDVVYVDEGDSVNQSEFVDRVTQITSEVITFAKHGPYSYDQLAHIEVRTAD
jgi:hypothetical protein